MTPNLDLFPIGNCSISALIDRRGRYVWACAPRVDGDPFFSALMDGDDPEHGFWDIQLEGFKRVDQAYVRNTPVLRTVLTAEDGSAVEVLDFADSGRATLVVNDPGTAVGLISRTGTCRPDDGDPT